MSVIKTTLEHHIAIVTINRPEAYNAMNPNVIESLENQINLVYRGQEVLDLLLHPENHQRKSQ